MSKPTLIQIKMKRGLVSLKTEKVSQEGTIGKFKNGALKYLQDSIKISILIITLGKFDVGGTWIPLWEASRCFLFSYRYCCLDLWVLYVNVLCGKAVQRELLC